MFEKKDNPSGVVSIVIPVYNVEQYLGRCLDSLLDQQYRKLQIIIINDGSTDESEAVALQYSQKDNRIEYYRIDNCGPSGARNYGMRKIKGDYFCFVDPDDYLEQNTYIDLLRRLVETSADIVASTQYYVDYDDHVERRNNKKKVSLHPLTSKRALRFLTLRDMYNGVGGYTQTRMFRTECYKKDEAWKVSFDEDIIYGEGTLFLMRCMMEAKKVVFVEGAYYHYVQRESSAMHNYKRKINNLESAEAYGRIIDLYKQKGVSIVDRILMRRFLAYKMLMLAELAEKQDYHERDLEIYGVIRENYFAYVMTNLIYPSRVKSSFVILMRLRKRVIENTNYKT